MQSEHFFDFGNVEVETAAESPNFNFETIPHPQEFARKVMELYEELVHEEPERLKVIDHAEGLIGWKEKEQAQEKQPEKEVKMDNGLPTNTENQADATRPSETEKTPYQKQIEQAYKESGVLKEGEDVDLKKDENQ